MESAGDITPAGPATGKLVERLGRALLAKRDLSMLEALLSLPGVLPVLPLNLWLTLCWEAKAGLGIYCPSQSRKRSVRMLGLVTRAMGGFGPPAILQLCLASKPRLGLESPVFRSFFSVTMRCALRRC